VVHRPRAGSGRCAARRPPHVRRDRLSRLALAALPIHARRDAYELDDASGYQPDTTLVNYYSEGARLGMHQDKDEIINEPVVSISIGDSCQFRFGNVENRNPPYGDITLCSGDAFVFGHESRFADHAVPKTYPGTAPGDCGLEHGRINITMRMTGLQD